MSLVPVYKQGLHQHEPETRLFYNTFTGNWHLLIHVKFNEWLANSTEDFNDL